MSELGILDERFNEMAFPQKGPQGQAVPAPHGMSVNFYMHPKYDEKRSAEEGRPIYGEHPYVMIMVPGDKDSIVRRPVRTGQNERDDNNRFHNEYVAFVQKEDQPIEGTMLEQWPQITRAQVMELQAIGIRTVEHLGNIKDTALQNYMGLITLKQKATAYLAMVKEEAPMIRLQAEIESRDQQLLSMSQTMKEMQEELRLLKQG
jgi:hypothetical protein